ncbi:uncharacterized protein LOC134502410 [Candoia aspera]|uniref:uncharacterized protein LOC134502410 n=1 Tax=Candoia aspera TaxID=51853 RepID=UPI002FD86D24
MQPLNISDPDPPARPPNLCKLHFTSQPSTHRVPPEEFSLAMAYGLLAALMQCMTLGTLCVAASMQNWMSVEPGANIVGSYPLVVYTFGIPYRMNVSGSITNAEYLYFFGKGRDLIKPAMVTICLLSLCSGVAAFFLDYMQVQMPDKFRLTLVPCLHSFSGVLIMVLIAICSWCFEKINKLAKDPEWKLFHLRVYFGESFYISLLAFAFVSWAVVLSLCSVKLSKEQGEPSKSPSAKQ